MNLKLYKTYILKSYLYYFLLISLIFFILSFFLNILEEIVFFEKYNISIGYPFLLTFLNTFQVFKCLNKIMVHHNKRWTLWLQCTTKAIFSSQSQSCTHD